MLDLYVAVEGGTLQDAVVALATRYAVELPRRPERWHEWNNEKGTRRDELQRWRARRPCTSLLWMICKLSTTA